MFVSWLIIMFDINICMGKHNQSILKILSKTEIKSTHEVLKELEKLTNKTINWHLLYRNLIDLESKNLVEKLKAKAGFFWRKK